MTEQKFSTRLRKIMNMKNIKAAELSRRTGFSESLISQYLNDKIVNPSNDKILIFSRALEVDVLELMGIENLEATKEDLETVDNRYPHKYNDVLKLSAFNNLTDAVAFMSKYNPKLINGPKVGDSTVNEIIELANDILYALQEAIKNERDR